ncbi:hypothetical protein [Methylophaga sp. OBS4]|uniref:hypothetical protein n=1 Tax=Methylophaga sp. OBS4 TaxID=2991935 RepID=UPI002258ED62|nr:hypothetical protein [Methylophaga sp. OBS4]MCX4186309.1 hypothetical protein [Methylophaga sp. OBS4]
MDEPKSTLSFSGIGLGAIALLLAILHFWAGPFSPQASIEQTVAEKAISIKQATIAALKSEEAAPSTQSRLMDLDQVASIATATLGGLAIIFGVIGFAKKEPLRVAGGAAVLGGSAIAFQFAVMALGAIVLAILVAAVLSQIGIG